LKFKRSPYYFLNRGKNTNNFKGGYFKPEFVFGGFLEQRKIYSWYYTPWYDPYVYVNRTVVFGALIGNLGYQWTIGDNVAFDYYLGLGLGFSSKDDASYKGQNYAVYGVNSIYMQTGLKFGLMFKKIMIMKKVTMGILGFALLLSCPKYPTPGVVGNSAEADFVCNYDKKTPAPVQISCTNKSKNANSYIWDFGDGSILTIDQTTVYHT